MLGKITTEKGLIYRDGEALTCIEADKVASQYGYTCAEELVEFLKAKILTLEELVQQFNVAKKEENAAKNKRIAIEEEIAKLIETKANGSKTVPAGEGFKVTCKRGLTYKVDIEALRRLDVPMLPVKMIPAKPVSYAFDEKVYEQIVTGMPEIAKQLAEFITVTPKKTSITVKIG